MHESRVTLSLYPPFSTSEDLSDTLFKLAFQSRPYGDLVREVRIWRSGAIANLPLREALRMPDYLDPACKGALAELLERIVELSVQSPFDGAALQPDDASHVLIWDQPMGLAGREAIPVLGAMYHAGRALFIDPAKCTGDAGTLQHLLYTMDTESERQRSSSYERFIEATTRCWRRRHNAYMFAPGPTLLSGIDRTAFDDGVRIVCNSVVTSSSLTTRLRPDFICIADDFLHAGAILYAGEFRKALCDAMLSTEAYLICRAAHQRLFEFTLPESVRHRIVGVPCETHLPHPNLDLVRTFCVKDFGNILTMFMLPLATTFSNSIFAIGCDGRAPGEQQKVWAYAAELPIESKRWSLYAAHPAQSGLSGPEFVSHHEENVDLLCNLTESSSKKVYSLTPSHIPAFRERTISRRRLHFLKLRQKWIGA